MSNNNDTKQISRRRFLQATAAAGAVAAVGPWIVRDVRASSGEVNVYAWSDYFYPEMLEDFQNKTGIKVNLSTYGSNDEALAKLKTAGGKGFDIVCPSVDTGPTWYDAGDLLLPLDESKIHVDNILPALWDKSKEAGAVFRRKRYLIPGFWGTEAIVFDSSKKDYQYGELSYGDLWSEENKGLVTVRQKSALVGIALYLDATGQVPSNRFLDSYKDEATARELFGKALEFAIAHKAWVRQFWNNTQETLNAFQQNNCVIGQCWDGPSISMMKETSGKIRYLMPKEGGLGWLDTMAIPAGAANVEQAYAFLNHMLTPEMGAIYASKSGYNSAVKGADALLGEDAKAAFAAAYPADAIDRLWWWPPQPAWWNAIRAEASDKWTAA